MVNVSGIQITTSRDPAGHWCHATDTGYAMIRVIRNPVPARVKHAQRAVVVARLGVRRDVEGAAFRTRNLHTPRDCLAFTGSQMDRQRHYHWRGLIAAVHQLT